MIGYHILIPFFANGETSNDWPPHAYIWYEKNSVRGDLQGIIQNLPYLKDLGINWIWLSPIHPCRTTHGYDVEDYFAIAPQISAFGREDAYRTLQYLISEAHKLNIKILLDLVLNHISTRSPLKFKLPARKSKNQIEKSWQGNFVYLDHHKKVVREYLFEVGRHWLRQGIDGFRLDYVLGPPHSFWMEFATQMKQIKPDVILLGELWADHGQIKSGLESYLARHGSPGLTHLFDFSFQQMLLSVLVHKKRPPLDLFLWLNEGDSKAPGQWVRFLDNHDMPRFLDSCKSLARLKMALGLLFSTNGPICLEYGTETPLKGDKSIKKRSESGRVAMQRPKKGRQGLFAYVQKLIRLRKEIPSLAFDTMHLHSHSPHHVAFFKGPILIILALKPMALQAPMKDLIRNRLLQPPRLPAGIYFGLLRR